LVESRLRALGYLVSGESISLPDFRTSQNVLAYTRAPVRVVVLAHVDGVAGTPAANDNASGVAVLLELARVLRGTPGVLFAVTGAEERVQTGSRIHLGAARLLELMDPALPRRVRLAVNLDMVGHGTRLHVRGIERRPNRSARALLAAAPAATYLRDPGWSDHAELTRGGMPAAWLQWRDDPCWHRACDRTGRVDAGKLAATGEIALAAIREAL
ncbi:MAG: M28 family metallopeptidase, partial [Gaiellaceae bacterium]